MKSQPSTKLENQPHDINKIANIPHTLVSTGGILLLHHDTQVNSQESSAFQVPSASCCRTLSLRVFVRELDFVFVYSQHVSAPIRKAHWKASRSLWWLGDVTRQALIIWEISNGEMSGLLTSYVKETHWQILPTSVSLRRLLVSEQSKGLQGPV